MRKKKPRHQLYVVTDYWDELFGHRPYGGMLHDEDDKHVHADEALERAVRLSGAKDGDEVVIVVLRTGRRPYGKRRMRYVEPHRYEREPIAASVPKPRRGQT